MIKLVDAFNLEEAHVEGTFAFYDMFDSTRLKLQGEATWIPTTAYFFDTVREKVEAGGRGTIVKYLGDGVMVAYGDDAATAAINDAIQIQEALDDGVNARVVNMACSVGIATGKVVRFETRPGDYDYLGTPIDEAARLCSVSSPQAIFVDTATIDSAQMNRIVAKVGDALNRTPGEYKGAVQKANLKGFGAPVDYHEILWSRQPFGIKSSAITSAIDTAPTGSRVPSTAPTVLGTGRGGRGQRGVVRAWDAENHRGFIETTDGKTFYTDMRFVVSDDELAIDDVVYFVAQEPMVAGRSPVAGAVIALEQYVEARVIAVREGFGFLRVSDSRATTQDVFVSLSDCEQELVQHGSVEFAVGETARGARAEAVRTLAAA